jgi:aspartate ammonia-lyase
VRVEKDFLGTVELPDEVYYGVQTARAVENFRVSGRGPHPAFVDACVRIKRAAALANAELGALERAHAEAIVAACDEVLSGALRDQFVVDVFQAGAGTSHHMNVNEVLANRANELLGGRKGDYKPIHPNDHVNYGQSTNDVIPTAIRLAALAQLPALTAALDALAEALAGKAQEFAEIRKSGRTHLQDAVPMRLGQEFGAYAAAVWAGSAEIARSATGLHALGIGGTAAGTGLTAKRGYRRRVCQLLAQDTGLPLVPAEDLFAAMQSMRPFVALSGAIRETALELTRIANDLRFLSSGPATGLAEIVLPAVQPGSSIMPGKVNPVMAEMLNMVAYHVIGRDLALSLAAQAGQLELNVMMPLIAHELLDEIDFLAAAVRQFSTFCVRGITAHADRCKSYSDSSVGLATILKPIIGYAAASEVAKSAQRTGKSIRQEVIERNLMSAEAFDRLVDEASRPVD